MIYLVGTAPTSNMYKQGLFDEFLRWVTQLDEYQLDIETNMTPWWCDKKLITIQFGDIWDKQQWVLQWSALSSTEQDQVKEILRNRRQKKLIHNVTFEYVVLKFYGVTLENVYDTMLAEQILRGGQQPPKTSKEGYYGLADIAKKYLCLELDKSEQTTFGDDILTENKVIYAATDVRHLGFIRTQQVEQLKHWELEAVAALEMEVVLAYGDMTYNGIELNVEDWLANLHIVQPLIKAAKDHLDSFIVSEPKIATLATKLEYVSTEDRVNINWNSPPQKKELIGMIFPEIQGSSKAVLNKWYKDRTKIKGDVGPKYDPEKLLIVEEMIKDNYNPLFMKIQKDPVHWQHLIDTEQITLAGTVTLNWNSQAQVLPLLQKIQPKLKDMSKESFDKFANHPIFDAISDYKDSLKLETTYGQKFIDKYLEPDGKIRTRINQVLTTGRVSSSAPNMQNIPAKESVGNRYRNAFCCPVGWKYVDSDYSSQELVIIAYLSQDPVWMEALRKGQDLHSVCAQLVYGKKWKDAADPDCAYYKTVNGELNKQKCSCKKHKTLRNGVKTLNFGLCYGMTEFKLAGSMGSTVPEAKQLINEYFVTFPKIGALLNYLGRFGVAKGYIQTIYPFYRKRWFPEWYQISEDTRAAHLMGIEHSHDLGAIERAAKNMPIQGCAADITKFSLVLIRRCILDNKLDDKIKIVMQVHDQNTTICVDEIAEQWKVKMTELMEQAAFFVIPNGLLKAETQITDRWSK